MHRERRDEQAWVAAMLGYFVRGLAAARERAARAVLGQAAAGNNEAGWADPSGSAWAAARVPVPVAKVVAAPEQVVAKAATGVAGVDSAVVVW
ncbi:hypothetical protein CSQ86_06750 [Bifidobacterium felsineum]|uniref:Uncharacterized protein n=1 Tax=Bifidobacterium felsineum TaxID=2045440 RepID=A0A2M9HJ07_9BIFI|nr:hypothetical protein CSQ86_06750 [Bifidobacterium felsineum]